MPIRKMDPSCTIGFYCATKADFEKFCTKATEVMNLYDFESQHTSIRISVLSLYLLFLLQVVSPPMQKGSYPMFIVASGNCNKLITSSTDYLVSSMSFSDTRNIPTSEVFDYETGVRGTNSEMYRVQEVGGEKLALGDRPAEDYVVLGSIKMGDSFSTSFELE